MKKLLKIAVLTVFAITLLASCELFGFPKAPDKVVNKFLEAYSMASPYNNRSTDDPYDLKLDTASFDFNFAYDSKTNGTMATGDNANAIAFNNGILTLMQQFPISNPEQLKFKMTGTLSIVSYSEGNSKLTPFSNTVTKSKKYEFSVKFTDFDGDFAQHKYDTDADQVADSTVKDYLEGIFGNKTDGYNTVTISFKSDGMASPAFEIEGKELTTDNYEYKLLEIIWGELLKSTNEGSLQVVLKTYLGEDKGPGLKDYSYRLDCEKTYTFEGKDWFSKITDSIFILKAKVTDDSKEDLMPEGILIQTADFSYILEKKYDADIKIEAKLDDEDYVFTYSTDDGILSVNGKYYYWK